MSANSQPLWFWRFKSWFKFLKRNKPNTRYAESIDREYIEGETAEEIGKIGQMTDIPDKSERHPRERSKLKKTG